MKAPSHKYSALLAVENSLKIFAKKLHKTAFFLCEGRALNFFFLKEKVAKRSKNRAGLSLGFLVAR